MSCLQKTLRPITALLVATIALAAVVVSGDDAEATRATPAAQPHEGERSAPHGLVIFEDNSRILLDLPNATIQVGNDIGTWELPLGTVSLMKFSRHGAQGEARATITFPSGKTEPVTVPAGRQYFLAESTFGYRTRVFVRDIRALLGRVGIQEAAAYSATAAAPGDRVRIAAMSGVPSSVRMPMVVWRVKNQLGSVLIPSPLVREISREGRSSTYRLTTVYGDRIAGRLSPDSIRIPVPGEDDTVELATRNIRTVMYESRPVSAASGYRFWRLADGSLVCARLIGFPSDLAAVNLRTRETQRLAMSAVRTMRSHERNLLLEDGAGGRFLARIPAKAALLSLLVDARSRSVPWSEILACATDRALLPHDQDIQTDGDEPRIAGAEATIQTVIEPITGSPVEPPHPITPMVSAALIRGGSFVMGHSARDGKGDEMPPHRVSISPFHMDQHEVTSELFAQFAEEAGHVSEAERAGRTVTWRDPGFLQTSDAPVVAVSWYDAARFCNWRSREEGLDPCYSFGWRGKTTCRRDRSGYRLPTEAEWEYAARNEGKPVEYPWGDEAGISNAVARANFYQQDGPSDGWEHTSPVKQYAANAVGLYGMGGNVWEWCQDWYDATAYARIARRPAADPRVDASDLRDPRHRVMRGGSFANELGALRCRGRGFGPPHASAARVGFRCARTAIGGQVR